MLFLKSISKKGGGAKWISERWMNKNNGVKGEKSPLLSAHAGQKQKLWRDQIKESFVELVGMNGSNFKNEMLFLSFNTAIITTGNGWDIAQTHPFLICIWNFILTRERKRPVSFRYQLLKVPISRLRILDIYNVRNPLQIRIAIYLAVRKLYLRGLFGC